MHFPRRFDTIIQDWTFLFNMVCLCMLTSFSIKMLMENKCSTFKQLSRCPLIAESARVTCSFDYPGEKVSIYWKKCFKKLGCSTNQKVNFVCRYSVTKMSFFTNMKDKLNKLSKSDVVYQFSWPGCESFYIGKTWTSLG